jgi:hypothetical protein
MKPTPFHLAFARYKPVVRSRSVLTKKDSRLLVEPTTIEPAQPQSTCAHSPGANAKVRNAGARTRRTVRT